MALTLSHLMSRPRVTVAHVKDLRALKQAFGSPFLEQE